MRLNPVLSFALLVVLLAAAAGNLHADTLLTLGTSQGCTNLVPSASSSTCTLTARVSGIIDQTLTWTSSPSSAGSLAQATTACPGPFCSNGSQSNTFSASSSITGRQTVLVTVKAADGTTASAQVTVTPAVVTVQVAPGGTQNLLPGRSVTFTATVLGVSNTDVNWSMSPNVGTLTPGANNTAAYTAPSQITSTQTITIRATSAFDPTVSATGTVQLTASSVTVTPSSTVNLAGGATQRFTATASNLSPSTVTWSLSPQIGTLTVNGNTADYTAPNPIPSTQKVTITATSNADPSLSASGAVQLTAAALTVTPSATVTLTAGASQTFTAAFTNSTQGSVVWSMSPQLGTLTVNGLAATYTAPATIAASQRITITATSVDGTLTAGGSVQLNVASVTVTPSTVSLSPAQTQQFTAIVNNAGNSGVMWSISPSVGTIDQNGLYTAPGILTVTTKVTVTAASLYDPTRTGTATVTVTPLVEVGSGAPTDTIQFVFQAGFRRNGFGNVVVMPPAGMVKPFGATGYVQEFTDAATPSAKDAIVTGAASVGGPNVAFQILAPLYAYYSSVSANTAGYPLADSQSCAAQGVSCQFATFDKNYALFAYASALPNGFGPNLAVNGAFYTEWTGAGRGINGLGSAISTASNITASVVAPAAAANTAVVQLFAAGAIYSITSGGNRGKLFSVLQPLYDLYSSRGGPTGSLGLPTSEVFQLSNTTYKQTFEGGALQYTAGSGPDLLYPVSSIRIEGMKSPTVTLTVGQTVTLTATPVLTTGADAADRPVSWTTTNGKTLSIQANGGTAVVTAIGAGAASVQAASQGVTSGRVNFIVGAPCCGLGEGAPASVQQAFRDALTRNKLAVDSPLPAPAARVAAGYVQMAPAAGSNAVYLLAQSDRLGAAYVVSGAILARYQALGGAAGQLGYPASDATPGGTQTFAGGALGGTPVRLVAGPVLAKWALLGFDSGAAGLPTAEAVAFETLGANAGFQQSFSKGLIVGAVTGPRAAQAYFVTGLILARYNALGGPSGDFGMPVSDEFVIGGVRRQNFEGGAITYGLADSAALEHPAARVPAVLAFPAAVTAGARAHLAVVGFPNNSTLRVSVTGSPDFVVAAPTGAYAWEMPIALSAKSGAISIHAVDGSGASADGALTVRGFAETRIQLRLAQGDNQVALPGSLLPLPLRVLLADSSNNPVVGAAVSFTASGSARLSAASALTDASGFAEVSVRLPAADGVVGVTAASPVAQSPVTFYVRAGGSTLSNMPAMTMAGDAPLGRGAATVAQKGALLTAVATILRYHQNRGELATPNGPADPAALNDFLTQYCAVDLKGAQVCDGFLSAGSGAEQVVNLWRAADFTGSVDVAVLQPSLSSVADALAQGSPVLLSLALTRNGAPAGGHFVVATGIASDGSMVIQDPNPLFGRANLAEYLRGFGSAGAAWTGELRGAVRFALRGAPATRFLIGAISQPPDLVKTLAIDIQSPDGPCGTPLDLFDAVDGAGNPAGGLVSHFVACDGSSSTYQIGIAAAQPYRAVLTDLATAGSAVDLSASAAATWRAERVKLNLTLTPQNASFTADAVVNAATFAPGIAPGGIFSIFGSGLSGVGPTAIEFDGEAAQVLLASPFQLNAVAPAGLAPGPHRLRVRSVFGTVEQTVDVAPVAPGIFVVADGPTGAILNPDATLNTPSSPVARGQYLSIYATGLGTVRGQGAQSAVTTPVAVVVAGQELTPIFAGLAPRFSGLYQVNVVIPAAMPPALGASLCLKQSGHASNLVMVNIR